MASMPSMRNSVIFWPIVSFICKPPKSGKFQPSIVHGSQGNRSGDLLCRAAPVVLAWSASDRSDLGVVFRSRWLEQVDRIVGLGAHVEAPAGPILSAEEDMDSLIASVEGGTTHVIARC